MVDISALKSHVNSLMVSDSAVLRLDYRKNDIKVGSFFGRIVNWLFSPKDNGLIDYGEVRRVKEAFCCSLGKSNAKEHALAQGLVRWLGDKPLTARRAREIIDKVEFFRMMDPRMQSDVFQRVAASKDNVDQLIAQTAFSITEIDHLHQMLGRR